MNEYALVCIFPIGRGAKQNGEPISSVHYSLTSVCGIGQQRRETCLKLISRCPWLATGFVNEPCVCRVCVVFVEDWFC